MSQMIFKDQFRLLQAKMHKALRLKISLPTLLDSNATSP